jgi:Flp pilus assembly protein TadG
MWELVRNTEGCHVGTKERGAAAVEFAMALMPLMVLCWGTTDLGLAFFLRFRMANAAHVAAQACTANGTVTATCASTMVTQSDVTGCSTTIEDTAVALPGDPAGIAQQGLFAVTVTCDANFLFLDQIPGGSGEIAAKAVMPYIKWLVPFPAP